MKVSVINVHDSIIVFWILNIFISFLLEFVFAVTYTKLCTWHVGPDRAALLGFAWGLALTITFYELL